MARVTHFEIHADNVSRAVKFYSSIFEWKIEQWGGQDYWLITTGEPGKPGINGGLMPRRGPGPAQGQPVNAYPCTIEVDNLDAYVAKVEAGGGTIALPKMPVPTVGWLAYCHDTEGNIFGMMQLDPGAK